MGKSALQYNDEAISTLQRLVTAQVVALSALAAAGLVLAADAVVLVTGRRQELTPDLNPHEEPEDDLPPDPTKATPIRPGLKKREARGSW